jgi:hypothetical protein
MRLNVVGFWQKSPGFVIRLQRSRLVRLFRVGLVRLLYDTAADEM